MFSTLSRQNSIARSLKASPYVVITSRNRRRGNWSCPARTGVCVVGPGKRFLSGLTYHTYVVAELLAERETTSVIFLRQLLPTRWYPGGTRVGADLSHLRLSPRIARFDGVDWYWLPSLLQALWFLARRRPRTLLIQWWTAAAAHTQLVLALAARALGARVVVELHEIIDPGEAQRVWVTRYGRMVGPLLFRTADRFIVHSEHDRQLFSETYGLDADRVEVIGLPVHRHYHLDTRSREAPEGVCNILYFGVIRPFKGVEDLIDAFERLTPEEVEGFWLTVVGETWEGWTVPGERIATSPYRERITFVNRYVTDEEVDAWFNGADVVALPYHRSSMSGPLHVAMSYGLPIVTTTVGGLPEAVEHYPGAHLVAPRSPAELVDALRQVSALAGTSFATDDAERSAAYRHALTAATSEPAPLPAVTG